MLDDLNFEDSHLFELFFTDEDTVEEEGLVWKDVLKEGTWSYRPGPGQKPIPVPLKIISGHSETKEEVGMADIVDAFDDGAIDHVTVPTSHDDKPQDNTGFVKKLKIIERDGQHFLRAGIDFTEPEFKDKALRRTIANTSAGIVFDYIKKDSGKIYKNVLGHVALTNKPWLNGMEPFGVAASEGYSEENIIPLLLDDIVWDTNKSMSWIKSNLVKNFENLDDETSIVDIMQNRALISQKSKSGIESNYVVPFQIRSNGVKVAEKDRWISASKQWIQAAEENSNMTLELKDFTAERRRKLAKKGQAMPDGSFPIEDEEDLKNAIQAIGRAKNPSAAKAHIKKRARALGKTSLLPDSWNLDETFDSDPDMDSLLEAISLSADEIEKMEEEGTTMSDKTKERKNDQETPSDDPTPVQNLSEDARKEIADEIRSEFSEKFTGVTDENEKLRKQVHEMKVNERVEELKKIGFATEPGLLAEIQKLMLADQGNVVMKLSETGDNGDEPKEASLTASDIIERLIDALPKKDGKVVLSEQALITDDHDAPPSKVENDEDTPLDERIDKFAEDLGLPDFPVREKTTQGGDK